MSRCSNCGEKVTHCDRRGCDNELKPEDYIICYTVPGTAGRMHKHFCSMAHLTDYVCEETKKTAVLTTVEAREP